MRHPYIISEIYILSTGPFDQRLRYFSVKLHWISRWPLQVENCIWSYKRLSCVRLSISASFQVTIMFQAFLQVSFLSKPNFTKFHLTPIILHKSQRHSWPCAYFFNPHKPNTNSLGVLIIYLKALAHRFVYSIITVVPRPTRHPNLDQPRKIV